MPRKSKKQFPLVRLQQLLSLLSQYWADGWRRTCLLQSAADLTPASYLFYVINSIIREGSLINWNSGGRLGLFFWMFPHRDLSRLVATAKSSKSENGIRAWVFLQTSLPTKEIFRYISDKNLFTQWEPCLGSPASRPPHKRNTQQRRGTSWSRQVGEKGKIMPALSNNIAFIIFQETSFRSYFLWGLLNFAVRQTIP